jgi:hypothetical protein
VPSHFLADRRNGSTNASGDAPECVARGDAARNLFTLTEAEHSLRASTPEWCNTASAFQDAVKIASSVAQGAADPEDRLPRFISTPDFLALRGRNYRGSSNRHV